MFDARIGCVQRRDYRVLSPGLGVFNARVIACSTPASWCRSADETGPNPRFAGAAAPIFLCYGR